MKSGHRVFNRTEAVTSTI